MTDQRSAFRFRVPRLRPSVPPPRPPTQTTARRPPIRPQQPPSPRPQVAPSPRPQLQPVRPQGTAPGPPTEPALPSPPPPPLPVVQPALQAPPQDPAALPPTVPLHPLGTVPDSPPEPLVKPTTAPQDEPALLKTPSPAPVSPPTVPLHPLGTVPDSPPEPQVEPSAALIAPQDEPASITKSQPSSPSLTTIQSRFSSPPSSPPPQVKRSTEITSNNGQRGADPVLNTTPTTETNREIHEEAYMELSSEHSNSEPHIRDKQIIKTEENQHESEDAAITTSNIPNKPQIKSMTSLPNDKVPVQESPKHPEPNGPQVPYSDEISPSFITLAGENRGTSMHIGSSATKRRWKIHIHRKYKLSQDEIIDTTTDGDESSNEKKKENELKPNENKERDAYINCNIQGINNSVVYNCSITESNPGVHLGTSSNPARKPKRNKFKVNITPSESSKHTVRRRCLRGLFMESSSDSDPTNPQKPRRHGCRYKSNKDDNMDVV